MYSHVGVGRREVLPNTTIQTSIQFRHLSFQQSFSILAILLLYFKVVERSIARIEDRNTKYRRQITFLSPNKLLRIKRKLFPRLFVTEVNQEP